MANADMIFILNKYDEVIGGLSNSLPNSCPFFEDVHSEILENGYETIEFKTPIKHASGAPDQIQEENKILIKDLDDQFHVFRIKRVQDITVLQQKNIFAESESIELLNDPIRPTTIAGSPAQILTGVLNPSRWEAGTIETAATNQLVLDEYTSVLAALHAAAELFDLEIRFRIEFNGSHITGRYVDLLQRRGNPDGSFFTYSQDIKGLTRTKDTTELATALIGVGKSDESESATTFESVSWSQANGNPVDKPLGQDWVGDPDALNQFGVEGRHIFRVYSLTDESDPLRLLSATWDELQRRIKGAIEYEVELVLLEKLTGYEHKRVRIGDTITIKDTSFATPLVLEARVLEIKRSKSNPANDAVVLGEYRERELTESEMIRRLQLELARKAATWEAGGGGMDVIESDTAPLDPPLNQYWLDTSKVPNIWKRWDGTLWIPATPDRADQIEYNDGLPVEYYKPDQPGADKTSDNTSQDTENVGGTPADQVRDEAGSGQDAKDKIDQDVGSGTIETTTGSAKKSGPVSITAPTNPGNGDKWVDISQAGLEVWKRYNATSGMWEEIGRVSLDQMTGQIITGQIGFGAVQEEQLADLAVTLAKLGAGSVDVSKIVDNAISAAKIQTDAITQVKIANGAVGINEIIDAAITDVKIATDAVTNAKIANNAITAAEIVDRAITNLEIALLGVKNENVADRTLTAGKVVANSLTAGEIASRTITADRIVANSLTAGEIASRTITADRIGANVITAGEIFGKTITAAQITGKTITAAEIFGSTITTNEIAANTITALDIAATTITGDRMVANTITATQIATRTISADRLVANSITSNEILANTITASDILANTITAAQIASRSISADRLVANSITASEIAAKTITASNIAANTITTDLISAQGISADVIKGGTISGGTVFAGILSAATGTFSGMVQVGALENGSGLVEISSNGVASIKRTTIQSNVWYEYGALLSGGQLSLSYNDVGYSMDGSAEASIWMNQGNLTIDLTQTVDGYQSPGTMSIQGSLGVNGSFSASESANFGGTVDFNNNVNFDNTVNHYWTTNFNYTTNFASGYSVSMSGTTYMNGTTYFYGNQYKYAGEYDYSSSEPVTNRTESGYCGVGGMTAGVASSTTAVAGTGVNFRKRKTYTPSSIGLSSYSTNIVLSTHIQAIDIGPNGFWLYVMSGQASFNTYRYWRGLYTA